MKDSHYIIIVCSKGLKYFVEKKKRKSKAATLESGKGEIFVSAMSMVTEKLAKAQGTSDSSDDLSKYITVYFDYSSENDIPAALDGTKKYKLMDHLPQLYYHLYSKELSLQDHDQYPTNISKRNYFRSKAGRSLYVAICTMHQYMEQEPDWFEKQHAPSHSPAVHCQEPVMEKFDSGLVLNDVTVKQVTEHDVPVRAEVLTSADCHSQVQNNDAGDELEVPPTNVECCVLQPVLHSVKVVNQTDMPRDSGIYDSSVPSSELSLPLMDGLLPDQIETLSIAESISSSSGLGMSQLL